MHIMQIKNMHIHTRITININMHKYADQKCTNIYFQNMNNALYAGICTGTNVHSYVCKEIAAHLTSSRPSSSGMHTPGSPMCTSC